MVELGGRPTGQALRVGIRLECIEKVGTDALAPYGGLSVPDIWRHGLYFPVGLN